MTTAELTEVSPSFTEGLPLTRAALEFALERHAGQMRGDEYAPFVQHPLEVASLLSVAGYQDDVVASGVLHDVLEKTDTDAIELEARFVPTSRLRVRIRETGQELDRCTLSDGEDGKAAPATELPSLT